METIQISKQEFECFDRLRYEKVVNASSIREMQSALVQFYPKGTQVIITKDYFEIKTPE